MTKPADFFTLMKVLHAAFEIIEHETAAYSGDATHETMLIAGAASRLHITTRAYLEKIEPHRSKIEDAMDAALASLAGARS